MRHLNGNIFCAVDIETTGLDPFVHEIIEIALVPLDSYSLEIREDILPFNMQIAPENLDKIDLNALHITGMTHDVLEKDKVQQTKEKVLDSKISGIDKYEVAELLVQWFDSFKLGDRKKLIPIAHNWPFDSAFIKRWLGEKTFDIIFSPLYRDTLPITLFENDIAGYRGYEYPYAKNNLTYLCSTLKIDRDRAHRALDDAAATAKVFKMAVQMAMPRP